MKRIFILILILGALSVAASCESAPRDELGQLVDAEYRATEAALRLGRMAADATSRADATRQYLALQGQQTRIAQQAEATATAQSAQMTATVQSAQMTATVHTQNIAATATMHAYNVLATMQSASATATANAASAYATQASASATATANAASAMQTRTSADATATVIAAYVRAEEERAEWTRRLESARAIATTLLGVLAIIALGALVVWGSVKAIDALVLRARVLRDKTGTVFVIGERDREGRQAILVPGRSPGAVISIAPPDTKPLLAEPQAVDEDTTKRDQAISLMIAATASSSPRGDEILDDLTAGDQIRFVDEPPAQLVDGEVKQLLDGDWKRLGDGTERGHYERDRETT